MSYIGTFSFVVVHDSSRVLQDFGRKLGIDPKEKARKAIWKILKFSHSHFFKDLRVEPLYLCLELYSHLKQFEEKDILPAYVILTHHDLRLGEPYIVYA